jgi:hypothetical protein
MKYKAFLINLLLSLFLLFDFIFINLFSDKSFLFLIYKLYKLILLDYPLTLTLTFTSQQHKY